MDGLQPRGTLLQNLEGAYTSAGALYFGKPRPRDGK